MVDTARPPQYILNAIGGSYDESKYRWNPDTMSLESRSYGGGSYYYGDIPDPSQGSTLVTDLSAFNASRGQDGAKQLAPGATPYFGFGDSAEGYNAGLMPGSDIFVSTDAQEIADYKQHARTTTLQGVAQVGALVGAAAIASALQPAAAASGAAPAAPAAPAAAAPAAAAPAAAAPAATVAPNGLLTGPMAAAGGGVGTLAGAVPAVGAGAGAAAAVTPTVFSRVGSFLARNRDIIGSVLTGIGESIVQQNAQEDLLRTQRELISANYRGADPGKNYRPMAQNTQTQKPHERFAPSTAGQGGSRLRFDPLQGKIVRELVPAGG